MKRVSVDPGQSTGVAIWGTHDWGRVSAPVATARIGPSTPKGTWDLKAQEVAEEFRNVIWNFRRLSHCYIEMPQLFGGSGTAAAGTQSITKLAVLVGMLARVARESKIEVVLIPVTEWKGMMPKKLVHARMKQIMGQQEYDRLGGQHDVLDAVAIGLYAKGVL